MPLPFSPSIHHSYTSTPLHSSHFTSLHTPLKITIMPSPSPSQLFLLLFSLSTLFPHSLSSITTLCKATQFPLTCQSTLLNSSPSPSPSPTHAIQTTLSLTSHHIKTAQSMVHKILTTFPNHHNRTMASHTCLDLLSLSSHRTSDALPSRAALYDARAWASAALTYQYDCWSELSYVNGTRVVDQTMQFLTSTLIQTTSNALSMIHALLNYGGDVASWHPPLTERDGFWESSSGSGSGSGLRFELGSVKGEGRVVNVSVCKEGKARGCYAKVQEAVDSAPGWLKVKGRERYVIYIKEGVYEEIVRVPLEKRNLVFIGDGKGKTVITGAVNTGVMGISTYNTATVGKFTSLCLFFSVFFF